MRKPFGDLVLENLFNFGFKSSISPLTLFLTETVAMKTLWRTIVCLGLTALIVSLVAPAKAEILLYNYDFENLNPNKTTPNTNENLIGQDVDTLNPNGWVKAGSRWPAFPNYADKGLKVLQGTDANVNTSIVVKQTVGTSWGGAYQYRNVPQMTFTSADTNIVQYVKIRDGNVGDTNPKGLALAGFEFTDLIVAPYAKMGIYSLGNMNQGQGLKACWRAADATYYLSQELLNPGHWYEFKAVMDFSYVDGNGKGGKISVSYRNLTTGGDWIVDPNLTNCPMKLTPTNGSYTINAVGIFSQQTNNWFDDIKLVNAIPEPSTLALLVAGFVGLAVYAWRKQK
jgi:hypothetical protein